MMSPRAKSWSKCARKIKWMHGSSRQAFSNRMVCQTTSMEPPKTQTTSFPTISSALGKENELATNVATPQSDGQAPK
jgi:hypothetical protein